MGSNQLLMRNLQATDLSRQGQGALLVVRVEHMLQHVGVKVGPDLAVSLVQCFFHSLGSACICCTFTQSGAVQLKKGMPAANCVMQDGAPLYSGLCIH